MPSGAAEIRESAGPFGEPDARMDQHRGPSAVDPLVEGSHAGSPVAAIAPFASVAPRDGNADGVASLAPRRVQVRDLGRIGYGDAFALQQQYVEQRKRGEIPDQFLFVEHPHVVTMGRSGHDENLLAPPELLARAGIEFHRTDRGGDVTYHGPGQIVGYPIFDLREWKRDVVAYVRGIEQVIIDALAEFGIASERVQGATGVWTPEGKIAAIGVHISRWVTSHGFALNVDTDLNYFRYIVPCGLTKPVTSMRALGCEARRDQVIDALVRSFARVFGREMERL
jgi:lipoyl(octanoyl) transferase